MVEHFYLYWLYVFHREFWLAGGSAGILGKGGIVGSPVDRPYLHFVYNYLEVMPLVIAFWDQGWLTVDRFLRQAFPRASEADLVTATAVLKRLSLAPGSSLPHHDASAQRAYIVARGEVEVMHQDEAGRGQTLVLGPGQSFEAFAPARATQPTELLVVERETLRQLRAA
jgi:hypothetical protein